MSLCKNPTSWIASMPFSIWYPSLQCINLHKLFFAPRSCLKCKSSFIKDVIFCLRNRTKCTERGSRGFSRNKLTRSKISSISWISSIYYKDFNNNPPESGGEREGSPGLGSPQLRQVLGLELHHHVVKPGEKIFQPKLIEFVLHLSFRPHPMNRQTCSRPEMLKYYLFHFYEGSVRHWQAIYPLHVQLINRNLDFFLWKHNFFLTAAFHGD